MKRFGLWLICLAVPLLLGAAVPDFSKIRGQVSEFTLDNGLKFILLEDHSVPIATFVTWANVGASDERIGIYGISHMLEHLAFKGTTEVGTTDAVAEKKILDKMDAVYDRLLEEKAALQPDESKIAALDRELKELGEQAGKYVVTNELDTLLKKHGGVGLNAGTSADSTVYFFSLPSNKAELWAHLESSRFTDPVLREFYKEKNVIMEERRMGRENQPVGKLIEQFASVAFMAQPYSVDVVGPMSNLQHITTADVRNYFREYYGARNLTIGVAGDITPAELKRLAQKYFMRIPPGKKNRGVFTVDPEQLGEKTVTLVEETQPWLIIGYHIPAGHHPDFLKFSVLNNILTNGRSSRLYKKLTIDEKSALAVASFAGYPGSKYPSLYLVLALPNSGHGNDELQKAVFAEIEKLKSDPVSDAELESAKNRLKVAFYQRLQSNQGLLQELLQAEVMQGDWRKMFDELAELDKIGAADIQELARKYLTEKNRTIGRIESKGEK